MNHRADVSLDEPLDDEERVLMDPDTWDWDAAEALQPDTSMRAVLTIRLSREELPLIGQAAHAEGATLPNFVQQSARQRALHGARS